MGIKYKWNTPSYAGEDIKLLMNTYSLSENVSKVLYSRNIITPDKVQEVLVGEFDEGFDPFLINDMQKAVDRIHAAIEKEEKILVYGDYDADGITSTVLMIETLSSLGADVTSYIPNRFTEGYGPNKDSFEKIIKSGVSLIITVDNGIAAVDEIDFANTLKCDVIITDHHQIQDEIPNAYAVVHPEHPAANYPFGKLAGVGVAFKLAHALLDIYPDFLLDLVAIGTVADMVPMTSENRIFTKQGLKVLNENPRLGIEYLLNKAGHKTVIDEQTIGFTISPRLNSIGRMDSAKEGLRLLTTEDIEEAIKLANIVEEYNINRKEVTNSIIADADHKIQSKLDLAVNLISGEDYHEGVLGIVASNLVEKYKKPVLVATEKDNLIKGSARSMYEFNIYEAMNTIKDKFIAFGGHHSAAGFSAEIDNVKSIEENLSNLYREYLTNNDTKLEKNIDIIANLEDISYQFINELETLKPFGNSFENAVIMLQNVNVLDVIYFGSEKQYLKLLIGNNNEQLEVITFKDIKDYSDVEKGDIIDIIFTLNKNYFNGRVKLQLQLLDLEIKEYLVKDLRGLPIDWQNLPIGDLKISRTFSDHKNNYYKYVELNNLTKQYQNIHILELPNEVKYIQKIMNLNAKSINLIYNKSELTTDLYKIDKDRLIKLFNILLKYNKLKLTHSDNIKKILTILDTNINSLKLMISILEEVGLVVKFKNIIRLNDNYTNVNLENSTTYVAMNERFKVESIFENKDISQINEYFKNTINK